LAYILKVPFKLGVSLKILGKYKKRGSKKMISMKKPIILILLFAFMLISIIHAYQTNSSTYKQNVIVSVGGENVSSPSYKTTLAIGIISRIIDSASYINKLGFFYTWKLANNQPCSTDSQCEGGFCCSNLCASSTCPSAAPGGGGGAAAVEAAGGGGELEEKIQDFSISPSSIKEQLAAV
jgi:hypothetical protein